MLCIRTLWFQGPWKHSPKPQTPITPAQLRSLLQQARRQYKGWEGNEGEGQKMEERRQRERREVSMIRAGSHLQRSEIGIATESE